MDNFILKYISSLLLLLLSLFSLTYSKERLYSNLELLTSSRIKSCLIRNSYYEDEFLYAYNNLKVYTDRADIDYIQSVDQLRWVLMPFKYILTNETYYHIINTEFDKILCATDAHFDLIKYRRKLIMIYFKEINEFNLGKCLWRFKFVDDEYQHEMDIEMDESEILSQDFRFNIINVGFNEAIYAPSNLFRSVFFRSRRNVYAWHSIKPKLSKSFNWFIFCS